MLSINTTCPFFNPRHLKHKKILNQKCHFLWLSNQVDLLVLFYIVTFVFFLETRGLLRTEGRHAHFSHLKVYINDGFIIIKSSTYRPVLFFWVFVKSTDLKKINKLIVKRTIFWHFGYEKDHPVVLLRYNGSPSWSSVLLGWCLSSSSSSVEDLWRYAKDSLQDSGHESFWPIKNSITAATEAALVPLTVWAGYQV